MFILGVFACGWLNSGCLVVSSNHVSKPVAAKETVALRHDDNADESTGWYTHHVHSSDVDFDVAVQNNAERLQVGFLFWVIPVPFTKSSVPDAVVQLNLQPLAGNQLTIDPWSIQYRPAENKGIAPVKIWREENGSWKPVPHGQLSINKPESLRLDYNAPCNPDLPFTLLIAGVPMADHPNFVTINYERAKLFHTGFRLPY